MADEPAARTQYWERHIARYLRGGLSRREYCERHELKSSTFDYWRRRLRQGDVAPPVPPAVHIVRVDLEPTAPSQGASVEVVLGNGRCIRVANDFDPSTLARVVITLEGLS